MPAINLTHPLRALFDASRRRLLGDATLYLLDHAPIGERGYVRLQTVAEAWMLLDGSIGAPSTLLIAEGNGVDAAGLGKTVAFAISGAVWKIEENGISAPLGPNKRVWKFQIRPTGETVNL